MFSFHEEATIDMRNNVVIRPHTQMNANRISDLMNAILETEETTFYTMLKFDKNPHDFAKGYFGIQRLVEILEVFQIVSRITN